jgi:hypothetical protein
MREERVWPAKLPANPAQPDVHGRFTTASCLHFLGQRRERLLQAIETELPYVIDALIAIKGGERVGRVPGVSSSWKFEPQIAREFRTMFLRYPRRSTQAVGTKLF